ncbi:hypothetical protein Dsin_025020 [Dipteronia sinensis]|uniref:Uncharacterized protein n=1 Tax=Dipteronia sinensis TaxID=43782 RepID=A0AAE0DWF9_9ROSI|nr:hypothetical protein Dsin_025020 [Dipteronia sinensis]
MASKLLLEYFALHTYFLLDATYSVALKKSTGRFKFSLPVNFDDSFHLEILKEALLRAIHDIDATFSKLHCYGYTGSKDVMVLFHQEIIITSNSQLQMD